MRNEWQFPLILITPFAVPMPALLPLKVNPVIRNEASLSKLIRIRKFCPFLFPARPLLLGCLTARTRPPPRRPACISRVAGFAAALGDCPLPAGRTSSIITVDSAPAPCNVIFLSISKGVFQVAVPAGTLTTSPSLAEPMAALTSANETLFAVIVAASARLRQKIVLSPNEKSAP